MSPLRCSFINSQFRMAETTAQASRGKDGSVSSRDTCPAGFPWFATHVVASIGCALLISELAAAEQVQAQPHRKLPDVVRQRAEVKFIVMIG